MKGRGARLEWTQLPVQFGAFGFLLIMVGVFFRLVANGRLVPQALVARSTLDDVRADRDARLKEANEDADEWRRLWEQEREAHELTRQAYAEEIRGALVASTEGAQVAAKLLQALRDRQIEARP
jgi:hypothetical protein